MVKNQIAFLFPGQGSQSVGMGGFLREYPIAQKTFEEADQALGEPLSKIIENGPQEKLKETAYAQPAILTISVAIGRVLNQRSFSPSIMAGHSLGEYSALVLSDVLSFEDAVRLVQKRGRFMQEAVPLGKGTMLAVLGMEDSVVEEVCEDISKKGMVVEPANYNCPGQLVISGTVEGVEAASEELKKRGCKKCVPLQVSAPFHCSLLKPAGEELAKELEKVTFRDPKIPYVANVDCSLVSKKEEVKNRLIEQVWKPVKWRQSLQMIFREWKLTLVAEVGPGKVVCGHVKKIDQNIACMNTDTLENLMGILDLVK